MKNRYAVNVPEEIIASTVRLALDEDIGGGDLGAALLPEDSLSTAVLLVRENGVLCGCEWFNQVFQRLDPESIVEWFASDSEAVGAGQTVCRVRAHTRALLTGERTAINFLQTLSGTATIVAAYVKRIRGTSALLLDTRKTIPGLRSAQKYAVACGGGGNHRMGLYDALLIKENHILAQGGIANAVATAKKQGLPVEIEVENLDELEQALAAKADRVLLDNFTPEGLRQAVAVTRGRAKLEASGGIDESAVREVAETGVDFISIGGLTKHVRAIDFSMRITSTEG